MTSMQVKADNGRKQFGAVVRFRSRWLTVVGSIAALVCGPNRSNGSEDALKVWDNVCGPRCVQYVLGHYGQECELLELVREAQWPDMDKGASMLALAQTLERRGVYTFPIALPKRVAPIKWSESVIVYLEPPGSPSHFVVLLPSDSDAARVWDGVHGESEEPWSTFFSRSPNAVLFTSRSPISYEAVARVSPPNYTHLMVVWTTVAALMVLPIVLWRARGCFALFVAPKSAPMSDFVQVSRNPGKGVIQ